MLKEPRPNEAQLPFPELYNELATRREKIIEVSNTLPVDYFDAGIVRQVMKPNPDFAPGTELFNELSEVYAKGSEVAEDDLVVAGLNLGSYLLRDETSNPRTILTRYLGACLELDQIKLGQLGFEASTAPELRMLEYARKMIVERMPTDKKTSELIQSVQYALARFEDNDPDLGHANTYQWLKTKAQIVHVEHRQIWAFKHNIQTYYGSANDVSEVSLAETERMARTLTVEGMKHRSYGIKPAYTRASIGGSWIFYDGEDHERTQRRGTDNHRVQPYAAVVFHGQKEKLDSLKVKVKDVVQDGSARVYALAGALEDAGTDMAIYIQFDGTLTFDKEGFTPLSNILHDNPAALASIESEISANFFDLTMPIYKNAGPKLPPNFKQLQEQGESCDPILDLVVPRIRYIDELGKEENVEIDEQDIPVRTVRDHYVVWHRRTLRDGWSAGPDAIENARRHGIDLKPNETFVCEHIPEDGKDKHPILGHTIVRRAGVMDEMFSISQ